MKKLMLMATAALCASMFAAVQSDVVGYAARSVDGTDLRAGNQCFAPQFVSIGVEGVKLLDLGFDFSGVTKIGGEVQIQRLDKNGYTTEKWSYYKGQTRGTYKTEGWYDKSSTLVTEDNQPTFAVGEGLYLGLVSGVTLTTSGQVYAKDVSVTYDETGNKLLCNPYPTSLKLLDIGLDFGDNTKVGGEICIQRLDKNGYTTEKWSYYKGQTRGTYKTEGWYDKSSTLMTTENQPTFAAGEGLYFGALSGVTVKFTAPSL